MEACSKPGVRVLNVIESLDRGAVENWLVRAVRHAAVLRPDIQWTFFSILQRAGRLDRFARDCGWEVLHASAPLRETARFLADLRRTLLLGRFDIVHFHHDYLSGLYLLASGWINIRRRIVHVHNTDAALPTPSRIKTVLMKEPLRQICLRADRIVGISKHVLETFVGHRGLKPGRDTVLYYGIDLEPFRNANHRRQTVRAGLGLPDHAKVMLFVGRMTPLKNPCFVLEVLREIAEAEPNAVAIFAGSGPLEDVLRERAASFELDSRVTVLGWRDDIPQLMRAADVLIFPRVEEPKEGLGLVVVEAQAAGLPTLTSFGVADEAIVSPEFVRRLRLASGPRIWAHEVLAILRGGRGSLSGAVEAIATSRFSMDRSARGLLRLYE